MYKTPKISRDETSYPWPNRYSWRGSDRFQVWLYTYAAETIMSPELVVLSKHRRFWVGGDYGSGRIFPSWKWSSFWHPSNTVVARNPNKEIFRTRIHPTGEFVATIHTSICCSNADFNQAHSCMWSGTPNILFMWLKRLFLDSDGLGFSPKDDTRDLFLVTPYPW